MLSVLHVLYLILLAGSLAFGLGALLIGLGGRVTVIYRRSRGELLKLALPTGLVVVGLPIAISAALALEPLYLCALVLLSTFVIGGLIGLSKGKLVKLRAPPTPALGPEREIESMLERRGFGGLLKRKKKSKKRR